MCKNALVFVHVVEQVDEEHLNGGFTTRLGLFFRQLYSRVNGLVKKGQMELKIQRHDYLSDFCRSTHLFMMHGGHTYTQNST